MAKSIKGSRIEGRRSETSGLSFMSSVQLVGGLIQSKQVIADSQLHIVERDRKHRSCAFTDLAVRRDDSITDKKGVGHKVQCR